DSGVLAYDVPGIVNALGVDFHPDAVYWTTPLELDIPMGAHDSPEFHVGEHVELEVWDAHSVNNRRTLTVTRGIVIKANRQAEGDWAGHDYVHVLHAQGGVPRVWQSYNYKGRISSPLARALIGKSIGDEARVQAPGGTREVEITDVQWLAVD